MYSIRACSPCSLGQYDIDLLALQNWGRKREIEKNSSMKLNRQNEHAKTEIIRLSGFF